MWCRVCGVESEPASGWGEKDRETERQRGRETERQRDRENQRDRETEREGGRKGSDAPASEPLFALHGLAGSLLPLSSEYGPYVTVKASF